jgi:hypothetical protein
MARGHAFETGVERSREKNHALVTEKEAEKTLDGFAGDSHADLRSSVGHTTATQSPDKECLNKHVLLGCTSSNMLEFSYQCARSSSDSFFGFIIHNVRRDVWRRPRRPQRMSNQLLEVYLAELRAHCQRDVSTGITTNE